MNKVLEVLFYFCYGAQRLCCKRWISCGTEFITIYYFPYLTQVDVLTILHETMLILFSRISQGSAIVWEISFIPFCRELLPLVAEILVMFRASISTT